MNYEIERKYLIERPDEGALSALPEARVSDIVQTYLTSDVGERRVRRWTEGGKVTYFYTFKLKKSSIRRIEIEEEIDEAAYLALLGEADPAMRSLHKRRYTIPYGPHTAEIDIYPFFPDTAILEIELGSEEEEVLLPDFLRVIREVTGERAYKNPVLARREDASRGL